MGSKSEDQLSASPLSLSCLACFPHWGPPPMGQSSGCQTRKGQSGGFISTLWRKCRSKPFSSFHVKGIGVRCHPAYSGEMPTFPPRPASHLPHCLGDSIFQLLIVLPHWITQFSNQLHYSISLPKSLPWSHPHISNSQHPRNSRLFSRKPSSLVLTCVTGTNLGAQDTNLSPKQSLSRHPHPPGHLCDLPDLSQILPHLCFPTALH